MTVADSRMPSLRAEGHFHQHSWRSDGLFLKGWQGSWQGSYQGSLVRHQGRVGKEPSKEFRCCTSYLPWRNHEWHSSSQPSASRLLGSCERIPCSRCSWRPVQGHDDKKFGIEYFVRKHHGDEIKRNSIDFNSTTLNLPLRRNRSRHGFLALHEQGSLPFQIRLRWLRYSWFQAFLVQLC